ncbi:MAG: hypothetical protein AB2A00_23355 [Myxococcota bacterium]
MTEWMRWTVVVGALVVSTACVRTAYDYDGNYNGDLVRRYESSLVSDEDTETVDQGVSAVDSNTLRVEFESCPLEFKEEDPETSSRSARYELTPRSCTRDDQRHEFKDGFLRVNSDGELDYEVTGNFTDDRVLTLMPSGTFRWTFSGKRR